MKMRGDSLHKEYWKRLVDSAQILAVLFAGLSVIYSTMQLNHDRAAISADIALRFDDRLKQKDMSEIGDDVEAVRPLPILISHHGKFTDDQLEQFIGNFDAIYYLYKEDLITKTIAYDFFCTDAEDAFQDEEVSLFLKEDRSSPQSATDYVGFDKLAHICLSWDKTGEARKLEE